MKITKYEHACLVIEENGKKIVIDPGMITVLPNLEDVVALFITHIHGDHLDKENIQSLLKTNPKMEIYGSDEVVKELDGVDATHVVINAGDLIELANFKVEVGGDDHAIIYQSVPCKNRTLTINDTLYYPGDSFSPSTQNIDVVAVPASAPWMKTAEVMEFIKTIKVKKVFPTHNGLLSDFGKVATYRWINIACEEVGTEFVDLKNGESLEL